ncbi:MAG: transporter substrate-binding domain-containing protein [Erysipelotrichia bacterium]|nr:transporter substrate-binding domain-containing protein [Erysipelotrichia bacterium]
MKTLNQLFKAALAATSVISLSACSTNTAAVSSAAATSAPAKNIIIAISPDYPPFDSLTADGKLEGFDYDMGEWIFQWLNDNGYNYTHEWKQMSFDTIVSAIQTDQVDLGISGFTYDKDRKVLFSDPYYDSAQVAVVAANSSIASLEDLKGKKIGAQLGTTGETCANAIEGASVQAVEDMGIVMETLKSGGIDAAILDIAVAENYVATGNFKKLDGSLLDENVYIIAKDGNTDLMNPINEALAAFLASDDFNTYKAKWINTK